MYITLYVANDETGIQRTEIETVQLDFAPTKDECIVYHMSINGSIVYLNLRVRFREWTIWGANGTMNLYVDGIDDASKDFLQQLVQIKASWDKSPIPIRFFNRGIPHKRLKVSWENVEDALQSLMNQAEIVDWEIKGKEVYIYRKVPIGTVNDILATSSKRLKDIAISKFDGYLTLCELMEVAGYDDWEIRQDAIYVNGNVYVAEHDEVVTMSVDQIRNIVEAELADRQSRSEAEEEHSTGSAKEMI